MRRKQKSWEGFFGKIACPRTSRKRIRFTWNGWDKRDDLSLRIKAGPSGSCAQRLRDVSSWKSARARGKYFPRYVIKETEKIVENAIRRLVNKTQTVNRNVAYECTLLPDFYFSFFMRDATTKQKKSHIYFIFFPISNASEQLVNSVKSRSHEFVQVCYRTRKTLLLFPDHAPSRTKSYHRFEVVSWFPFTVLSSSFQIFYVHSVALGRTWNICP